MGSYDLGLDFMDRTDDGRLWTRIEDARADLQPVAGAHFLVGDDEADPAVARVVSVDTDGSIELEVLPGSVDSHQDLVSSP